MRAVRLWAVRHAALMERAYGAMTVALRGLRPLARVVGAQRLEKPVAGVERAVKGFLFDCRMCGRCALSANGMACPMNCPKQVRNGPCGGVRADGTCEAEPGMPCVGLQGREGAAHMAAGRLPEGPTAPPEHDRAGRSTWLPIIMGDASAGGAVSSPAVAPAAGVAARPAVAPAPTAGTPAGSTAGPAVDAPVRPAGSPLQQLLASGAFVVTAEFAPPDSADPADVLARLDPFRGNVDALNVTDASGANCHMSSAAVSVLLARAGCEPVMQVTCRDRNRIAIQGDVLGAAALGVRNVLCLTGDHVGNGDHPGARHVGDLDSVTLLAALRRMRDAGELMSGRKLTAAPRLFLGAAGNPSAESVEIEIDRLRRKVAAGAQFVQTQYCFDLERLERYMRLARAEGLHQRAALVIGVGPIASAKTAKWLRANVPGVHIPDAVVARLEGAADAREEGRRICVELIRGIRGIAGIAGVHLMAHRQERLLPSIVAESGVFSGRAPLFCPPQPQPQPEPQPLSPPQPAAA